MFNFIVRQRIHRDDHEEFLFSLHPVFIAEDGTSDDRAAKLGLESYSESIHKEICTRLRADEAYELAKGCLQNEVKTIWDWEEDVSLLNVAMVAFGT